MDRAVCSNYLTKEPENDLFSEDKNLLKIMMQMKDFSARPANSFSKGLDVLTKDDYENHMTEFKDKVMTTKKELELETIRDNRRQAYLLGIMYSDDTLQDRARNREQYKQIVKDVIKLQKHKIKMGQKQNDLGLNDSMIVQREVFEKRKTVT